MMNINELNEHGTVYLGASYLLGKILKVIKKTITLIYQIMKIKK